MNAELEQAVAYFADPGAVVRPFGGPGIGAARDPSEPSRWRRRMAQRIAQLCEADRFGVKAIYLLGNTVNGLDGPEGELELLVVFDGTERQRQELETWLRGWNAALTETNNFRTGLNLEHILVCRFLGPEAADKKTAAAKLNLPEESLVELPLRSSFSGRMKRAGFPSDS